MAEATKTFPHPLYEKYVLQPFFKDAEQYYYAPMLAANRVHVVMLHHSGIITTENARALLTALDTIAQEGLAGLGYEAGVEDLFFTMERRLIALAGPEYGGNLQLARSRNDLGYALTRLALRDLLLKAAQHLVDLRVALLNFARQHLRTLMPGYTHTQPAQPTTMAHYIAGMLAVLDRDFSRIRAAHYTNNMSPLGAAALTGTGFPIDRELSAKLLAFDEVMLSTYDSIGASDNLTEAAASLSTLGVNLSRFTHDMLVWARQESGAIRIDDSFIQISSIMPQKRNPVVLEHLRARISRMLGQTSGVVIQCHNIPFGDTQDIEDEIFPMLFGSVETAIEILDLYAAVMQTLHVNVDHLRDRAAAGFTTVTELADTLVREAGLPFRQAHSIVSAMVTMALRQQLSPADLTPDLLAQASEQAIGRRVTLSAEALANALDPAAFVALRSGVGGAAPEATALILGQQADDLDLDQSWVRSVYYKINEADTRLRTEIDRILRGA